MINDGEFISVEEFFGDTVKAAPRVKKARETHSPEDEGRKFAELKIRTAMKARGVSRETAVRQLKAEAKARAEEAERREAENARPDW